MAREEWIRAFAPASVSNVNCGFDIFGFAVAGPGDVVAVRRRAEPGVVLGKIEGDDGRLPRSAGHNSASVAISRLFAEIDRQDVGLEVSLTKGMPLRSGLGSSAASGVAAVVAAAALLELELPKEALLRSAVEGERVVCGSAHADNAAPSLYGGFVLVRKDASPSVVPLPVPVGLSCALVRPHLEIDTGEARALLGDQVPLGAAVTQWGHAAAFVAGLFRADLELMASALVDAVAEPRRAALVPGFADVRTAALEAGALGCGLSGSGPTLFALCQGAARAKTVAAAMRAVFESSAEVESDVWISEVGAPGARLLAANEDPWAT